MEGGHGHGHEKHEAHGGGHNEWIGNALKAIGIGYAVIGMAPIILPYIVAALPSYMTSQTIGVGALAFFVGKRSNAPAKGGHGDAHGKGQGGGHGGH